MSPLLHQSAVSRGLTLLELITAMAIVGILLGVAASALGGWLEAQRVSTATEQFRRALAAASAHARQTLQDVVFCPSMDGVTCSANTSFARRWITTVPARNPPESARVLAEIALPAGVRVLSNRKQYVQAPPVRRSTNGTLTLCSERESSAGRRLVVSVLGRARVERGAVCPTGAE